MFKIFENKKIISAIFLVIFLAHGLFFLVSKSSAIGGIIDPIIAEEAAAEQPADDCVSNLSWYESIVAGIADLLVWAPEKIASIATDLSGWAISEVNNWPITQTDTNDGAVKAFQAGWTSMRDLGNMLIVLGFVIVGIATAMRIREYEAKKALRPLIITALLINFSGLICGLVIDLSHLTMSGLMPNGATASMGSSFMHGIKKMESAASCTALTQGKLGSYLAMDVMFGFIYTAIAFCFIYLAFMLIARYAILGILFILSPIAFTFRAFPFPKAHDLWNKWWENFIKWAIIGVGLCFFLNLAGGILAGFPIKEIKPDSNTTMVIEYLFVVLMVIVVGIKITTKSSAIGAAAVMGLATGGIGFALGAIGSTAGAAAGATGLKGLASRAGAAVKDKATSVGEKYNMVAKGTTAQNQAGRLAASTKRLDAIQDNQQLAKIAQQPAITHEQALDKAAAAQVLAKRGVFNTAVDARKQDAVARHAMAFGVSKDTFTKGNPQLLTGSTDAEATQHWRNQKADSYVKDNRMTADVAKNLASKEEPGKEALEKAHKEIRQKKSLENALGLAPLSNIEINNKLAQEHQKTLVEQNLSQPEIERRMKEWKPSDTEMVETKEKLSTERIQKEMSKFDVPKIRSADKQVLSHPEFIKNVGAQRLDRAIQEMSQDRIKELKKLSDIKTEEGKALHNYMKELETKADNGDKKSYKEWADLVDKLDIIDAA